MSCNDVVRGYLVKVHFYIINVYCFFVKYLLCKMIDYIYYHYWSMVLQMLSYEEFSEMTLPKTPTKFVLVVDCWNQ